MNSHLPLSIGFFVVYLTLGASASPAPELINYQGRLVNGSTLVQGTTELEFRLYDAPSGGSLLYQETQTVSVVDGLYSTAIGLSNSVPGSLSQALTNEFVYVELQVGATILSPRERLLSVPYALRANEADGLSDSAVLSGDASALINADASTLFGSGTISTSYLPTVALATSTTGAAVIVSAEGITTGYSTLTQAWDAVVDGDVLHIYGTNTVAQGWSRRGTTNTQAELTWFGLNDVEVIGFGDATIFSTGGSGHQVVLDNCTNIVFRNVRFLGDDSDPVLGTMGQVCLESSTKYVSFENCVWEDGPNHGVITKHADGVNSHPTDVQFDWCTFLSGGAVNHPTLGVDGAAIADFGSRWRVSNCTVRDWARGFEIYVGHHKAPVRDVLIENTTVDNAYGSSGLMIYGEHVTQPGQLQRVTVRDCSFIESRYQGAIIRGGSQLLLESCRFIGGPGTAKGVYVHAKDAMTNVVIRGCHFEDIGGNQQAILVDDSTGHAQDVIIEGNTLYNVSAKGIQVPGTDCLVIGNTLREVAKAEPQTGYGILLHRLSGSGYPTRVLYNRILNYDSSGMEYGIGLFGAVTNNVQLIGNRIVGAGTADYFLPAAASPIVLTIEEDGTVEAPAFVGDGSGLTGIPSPWSGMQGAETIHTGNVTIANGAIKAHELSADPADPEEGAHVIWQSDGTDSGDDGDLMVKITAGGTTKTVTLIDYSTQ